MEAMEEIKSNYRKVCEFNETFGHPVQTIPQMDIWNNKKLVDLRMALIQEEFNELKQAVKEYYMTETFDALSDLLVVIYGMGASFGLDLDKGMGLVHESNMSKICSTEEEAVKTIEWYKIQFELGKLPYDSPNYRPSPDKKKWVMFNESSGKILKSINYCPVDFSSMLSENTDN